MPDQQPSLVRAPYGRHGNLSQPARREQPPDPLPGEMAHQGSGPWLTPYAGPTYYGLPAVKWSHYGKLISAYLFTGGLAGAAQVLASLADWTAPERQRATVRSGRYLALTGAALSPVFLITDLHRPERFFNMLRVFRPTSAMSIGSWTLAGFGTFSGLTAAAQLWADWGDSPRARRLAGLLGIPAAAFGSVMTIYTGSLLASTSTPFWAAAPRLLPALFGTSAFSTATAALSITLHAAGASEEEKQRVETFSLVSGAAELALAVTARKNWQREGVDGALHQEPEKQMFELGVLALGLAVPLAIHGIQKLTGRRSGLLSVLAAGSALVGGLLLRSVIVRAGNKSAHHPEDYLHFTRPVPSAEAEHS